MIASNYSYKVTCIAICRFVRKVGDYNISSRKCGTVASILLFIMGVGNVVSTSVSSGWVFDSSEVFSSSTLIDSDSYAVEDRKGFSSGS